MSSLDNDLVRLKTSHQSCGWVATRHFGVTCQALEKHVKSIGYCVWFQGRLSRTSFTTDVTGLASLAGWSKTPGMWALFELSARTLYAARIDHIAPLVEHRSLVIATTHPLPIGEAVNIPLYDSQHTTAVTVTSCVKRLRFTEPQLSHGAQFTSRLLRAILNRPLERQDDQLPYIILPLKNSYAHETSPTRRLKHEDIAWNEVIAALGDQHRSFNLDDLTRDACDAMITTPAEFSGRSYVCALEREGTEACVTLETASAARAHLSHLASPKEPVQFRPFKRCFGLTYAERSAKQCLRYAIHAR
jgi:hypothetical protein